MADNTFLGLQPYTEDDAYRFKGRAEESQELFRLIVRNDFTVCYAESGEGKTSLLNAGVFPLLRESMYFPIAITFTSDDYKVTPDSFDAIIDRCIKDSIAEYNEKNKGVNVEYELCSTDFQGLDSQAELQRELGKYSWWKLRNYKPQAMGLTFTPVFVFDQFEEVFNLPGSIVWTKKFFDWLEDVSSDSCPDEIAKKVREVIGDKAAFPTIKEEKGFKAVFSLRKEFIGELDYWGMQTHFIPALKDNRYCLKPLTYEGAKKVMTQQERFDEGKVEQVLTHFVGQYSREPDRTIEENLPIIPALLLSIVCLSWEKDIDYFAGVDENNISQSLNKVLERFYNETISTIVTSITKQEKNTSSYIIRKEIDTAMSALVDANGKRIRTKTTSSILTQIDFDEKYKNVLCNGRIIRIIKIDGEDYVEVVHDSLCSVIVKKEIEKLTEGNVYISYTRGDEKWAKWLQNKLEHFKLPTSLQKDSPDLPRTIRVLNHSDLPPGILSEQIFEIIKRSKHLIVLCSPRSAQSVWVNKEVETFISLGRTDHIVPFIIDGKPYAKELSEECFPPALRQLPEGKEILGANINEMGRDAVVVKLIARMLNVSFDVLWQRHKRERTKKLISWAIGFVFVLAFVLCIWISNQTIDVDVRLKDSFTNNDKLPSYSGGVISLSIGDIKLTDTVSVEKGRSVFTKIPKRYYNKEIQVTFIHPDYFPVDTIMQLTESFQLCIFRNPDVYGRVRFRLWNASEDKSVPYCKIIISGDSFSYDIISDGDGYVDISIPIENQRPAYSIESEVSLESSIIYMPCGSDDVILTR